MISAIILSAGEGKRIGFNKALLDWGGEPLINYQIKSLKHEDISEIIVVIAVSYTHLTLPTNREV